MNSKHLELRDGKVYCLIHKRPWKECPCPGQFSTVTRITREAMRAVTGHQGAYVDAVKGSR